MSAAEDVVRALISPLRVQSLQPLRHLVREDTSNRSVIRRLGGIDDLCRSVANTSDLTLSSRCEFLFTLAVCSDVEAEHIFASKDVARLIVLPILKESVEVQESLETVLFAIALLCLNCPAFRYSLHNSGVTHHVINLLEEENTRQLDIDNVCNGLTVINALCNNNESAVREVTTSSLVARLGSYLSNDTTRDCTAILVTTLSSYDSPRAATATDFLNEECVCILCSYAITNSGRTSKEDNCCMALYAVVRRWPRFQAVLAQNVGTTSVARAMCDGAARLQSWKRHQGDFLGTTTLPLPHFENATLFVWDVDRSTVSLGDAAPSVTLVPMSSRLPNGTWYVSVSAYHTGEVEEIGGRLGFVMTDTEQRVLHKAPAHCDSSLFDVTIQTVHHPVGLAPLVPDPLTFFGGVIAIWVPGAVTLGTAAPLNFALQGMTSPSQTPPAKADLLSPLLSVGRERRRNSHPARFSQRGQRRQDNKRDLGSPSSSDSTLNPQQSTVQQATEAVHTLSPVVGTPLRQSPKSSSRPRQPSVPKTCVESLLLEMECLKDENTHLASELSLSRQQTDSATLELAIVKQRLAIAQELIAKMEKEAAVTEVKVNRYMHQISKLQQKLVTEVV